jgi:anti-sigma factor RsiW
MKCNEVLNLAPLYLTGELEPDRTKQIARHVDGCASCAFELSQQRAFDARVRKILLAEPVDASAVESHVRGLMGVAGEKRSWRGRLFALAGFAATLVLAALYFTMRATPMYAAAARDHRLEIVDLQPRKWVTDRASIAAIAKGQGVADFDIDALAPAGYHLSKGKLCFLGGKVFLHLVYANGGENISVFLRPADHIEAVHAETHEAEHVAGFEDRKLSAVIVTEQSGDAALRLARSAAAVI